MQSNFLKLNDGKTEVLLIGSRQQLSMIALPGVTVGESLITPAIAVRDLGAVFDTHMTMVPHLPHVNKLSQSARYHIKNIGKISRFLDREYIADLLQAYLPNRALRSAGAHLLLDPNTTTTQWEAQAFSKAAPVLWNTLPTTIKTAPSLATFKLGVRTYLFKAAFLSSYVNHACQYFYLFKCILSYFYLTPF